MFPKNRNNQNVFKTKDSENMIVWRKKKGFCLTLPQPRGKVRQTWEIKGVKWDTPITHDQNTFEVMWPFYFEAPHFISHFPLHRPLAIVVKYSCIDFSGLSQFTPWAGGKVRQTKAKKLENYWKTVSHFTPCYGIKWESHFTPQQHFCKKDLF